MTRAELQHEHLRLLAESKGIPRGSIDLYGVTVYPEDGTWILRCANWVISLEVASVDHDAFDAVRLAMCR